MGDIGRIGARTGALLRRITGEVTLHPLTGDGVMTTATFASPVDADGIAEDMLITVGPTEREVLRALVHSIEPQRDYRAALTLIDEAPELHNG